jgi:hypothetical protein
VNAAQTFQKVSTPTVRTEKKTSYRLHSDIESSNDVSHYIPQLKRLRTTHPDDTGHKLAIDMITASIFKETQET